MDSSRAQNKKAAFILSIFFLAEGSWIAVNVAAGAPRFFYILGFAPGRLGPPLGWVAALIVVLAFVYRSARLPSVRENLFKPSALKLLAILMAVAAGTLEEAIFRRMLMNFMQSKNLGVAVQIAGSALAFGVSHGIWGLFGRSLSAAVGATLATSALGAALALVYILSDRSVAPCIVAHILIDVLIEPGLVLAAIRGEMRSPRPA